MFVTIEFVFFVSRYADFERDVRSPVPHFPFHVTKQKTEMKWKFDDRQ